MLRDLKFENQGPSYAPLGTETFQSSEVTQLRRADVSLFSSGISANSPILTMRGAVAARDLRVGDMVMTLDNGYQALRWIGTTRRAHSDASPIRFAPKTGHKTGPLVAEHQLVLFASDDNEMRFGAREVLCEAGDIAQYSPEFAEVDAVPTYVHLLFDGYEFVQSSGYWLESLQPDVPTLRARNPDVADEISRAVPKLSNVQGMASYVQTRPILDARETSYLSI